MARATEAEKLQQKATYQVGAIVQVYTIFDGWRECQITKLGWDRMFGRVDYYVQLVSDARMVWITNETLMKAGE